MHLLNPILEDYDFPPGVGIGNGVAVHDLKFYPRKCFVSCSCGWGHWFKGWPEEVQHEWVDHFQLIQIGGPS